MRTATDSVRASGVDSAGMPVKIDIAEAAERLQALHLQLHPGKAHQSIVVLLPLGEGQSEVVRSFLEEGPPFDPHAIGLVSHKVFLTDREALFVFETDQGVEAFERILAEPDFWDVVSSWERSTVEEPRVGTAVFEWREAGASDEAPGGRRAS
jgi:hypothetical protein